jgi:hypothetical protein
MFWEFAFVKFQTRRIPIEDILLERSVSSAFCIHENNKMEFS